MASTVSPRDSLSERICDQACFAFALWTLCCHAVVFAGGALEALLTLFVAACCVGFAVSLKRRGRPGPYRPDAEPYEPGTIGGGGSRWMIQGAGLALGLTGTLVYLLQRSAVLLWWWLVILLGAAAAWALSAGRPRVSSPARGRSLEAALWLLALGGVVLTLACHRPDPDDAFYVNVAVAAADLRGWPLLGTDTLHGVEGLPLHLPVYRVHSYELLNGALSYLTGIPAIYCFHWISAGLAALLVPLAHARLFRLLTPRRWLGAVAILMFLLVAVGETHRWYGNFSFVRMWHGKSIFLFVLTPLIYTYALRFALRPTSRGWLLLSAAQIAAVGATSSAIWAAPAASLMAMGCVLRPTFKDLRTLATGALASSYVLGIGWIVKSELDIVSAPRSDVPGVDLQRALVTVLGDARLLIFCVCAVLVTWAISRPGLARRFVIVLPLAASATFLNPYAAQWVSGHVTGPSYWRSLWALPVPIVLALFLLAPLDLGRRLGRPAAGGAICLLSLLAFAAWVPRYSGISQQNGGARLGVPTLKVPPEPYRAAALLNRSVAGGSMVAAPPEVNVWLPTFHDHAHALAVRHYLRPRPPVLSSGDRALRRRMVRWLGRPAPSKRALRGFLEGLDRFGVEGVCLRRKGRRIRKWRKLLRKAGFQKQDEDTNYEIWISSPRSAQSS